MTVKEILKLVCEFVGEKELADKLRNGSETSSIEQKKLDSMLNCLNLVKKKTSIWIILF